jgi:hypothetical protein
MQKQNVIVNIQPKTPETITAVWIATGPLMAASWVSSDILQNGQLVLDKILQDAH